MIAIAFVDFDNIHTNRLRNRYDAVNALNIIALRITSIIRDEYSYLKEIELRLYGGWVDEYGRFTARAELIRKALSDARCRMNTILVRPHMITKTCMTADTVLIGTVRTRANPSRQKMVDVLLAVDAIHYATAKTDTEYVAEFVISDDEDFVPCIMYINRHRSKYCHLIRCRKSGTALNDDTLIKYGTDIHKYK